MEDICKRKDGKIKKDVRIVMKGKERKEESALANRKKKRKKRGEKVVEGGKDIMKKWREGRKRTMEGEE